MDGIKSHLVGTKEPDYVIMFMTAYGTLGEVSDQKKWHYLENGVKHAKTFQTDLVGSELWFQVTCLGSKYQVYTRPVWRYAVLWHSNNTN